MHALLLALLLGTCVSTHSSNAEKRVTSWTPIDLQSIVAEPITVYVPQSGDSVDIRNPKELFVHVQNTWVNLVERNQAGLTEAKDKSDAVPLTPNEAKFSHLVCIEETIF